MVEVSIPLVTYRSDTYTPLVCVSIPLVTYKELIYTPVSGGFNTFGNCVHGQPSTTRWALFEFLHVGANLDRSHTFNYS